MKKQRIVIASVLKPVDDTRMLDKMGRSLEATGSYEVFIIGYPSERAPNPGDIQLIPLAAFRRLSLSRLLAPWKIGFITFKVKPHVLIVNTHELLIVACLHRILFGTRIFYDVRENYFRNLIWSNAFPKVLRTLLAFFVRTKEKMLAPFFHGFFLAEKGYFQEVHFFQNRAVVVENKAAVKAGMIRRPDPGFMTLLFTGTLADATGIFDAIRLAKTLAAMTPTLRLRIVGHCPVPETLKKINAEIGGLAYIKLIGGDHLVPHDDVVSAIFSADFGIVCYPPSPHTANSIPTKLYEYLSYSLPILLQNRPEWVTLCSPFQACIPFDPADYRADALLAQMQTTSFYPRPATGTTWESEETRFLNALLVK